jgi:transcriptional regulator with GAF, ATPase, and Fis domain
MPTVARPVLRGVFDEVPRAAPIFGVVETSFMTSIGENYTDLLNTLMSELTQDLRTADELQRILEDVTSAAVALVGGVDWADILVIDGERFRSTAPTDPVASRIDEAQQRFREGPCLQAAVSEEVIRCDDLRTDDRWPNFAAAAVELGVHSMLSFQLYTHRQGAGALNLLGSAVGAQTAEGEALGASLAAHAAVAITTLTRHKQFQSALASRDTIGQAKGIIMERFQVDAIRAFELLKRLSQDSNTPIRDIADRLTTTVATSNRRPSIEVAPGDQT